MVYKNLISFVGFACFICLATGSIDDEEYKKQTAHRNKIIELEKKVKGIPAYKVEENLHGYQELLKLDPDDAKYKKKVDHYRSKAEYNTLHIKDHYSKANSYYKNKKWMLALEYFKKVDGVIASSKYDDVKGKMKMCRTRVAEVIRKKKRNIERKVKSYSEVTYSQLNPSLPPARWNYSVERIEWLNKKKTKVKVLVRAERNYRYWGTDWYYYKEDSNGNWHMTLANGTRGIYGE